MRQLMTFLKQEGMQGFYMRSTFKEVVLALRRRTRDGQVAYRILARKASQVLLQCATLCFLPSTSDGLQPTILCVFFKSGFAHAFFKAFRA